jgi:hypothetical protein
VNISTIPTHIVARVGEIARGLRVALNRMEPATKPKTRHGATEIEGESHLVVRRGRHRCRANWDGEAESGEVRGDEV